MWEMESPGRSVRRSAWRHVGCLIAANIFKLHMLPTHPSIAMGSKSRSTLCFRHTVNNLALFTGMGGHSHYIVLLLSFLVENT